MKNLLALIDEENLLEVIRTEAPIMNMSQLLSLELIHIDQDRLLLTPKGRDLLNTN